MKTSMLAILASLAAFQVTAIALPAESTPQKRSLGPLPVGSTDGVYIGKLDGNGTTVWELVSPIKKRDNTLALDEQSLDKRANGVNCQNSIVMNSGDRANAASALINMCGNGYSWWGSAIAVQSGTAVAYGCNYGNGQTCYSWDISNFFASLVASCGNNKAAYWGQGSWKAAYGYTNIGYAFC
ncbi:hypothetical protein QBC38DRAFT_378005 [Podospora fimiseda]|uniref:Ecp2 effector protein domain-containing protein n=1 Tax=Podospora fimiseda TaxID=252190 RepID=A0AAN7BGF0_9PEZI|nr:hypothetical protein QBC38DRAFT_378005 [Podospora fimiseda]